MQLRIALALCATLSVASAWGADGKGYVLRLNVHQGQIVRYRLVIERDKPRESGEFDSSNTISGVQRDVINMDCRATGLKIGGKDRTADLKKAWGGQVAKLPWTTLSRRTGMATGYEAKSAKKDVIPYLEEAGVYLACFQKDPVKPGDSWDGSTTATGGCTSGHFTFKGVRKEKGKQVADFDVTNIMFINQADAQVGPMKMVVDLATGLPKVVDYKVKNQKTGRTSHFRQILVS